MALEALTITVETGAGLAEDEQSLVATARHDPQAAGRLFDRHYPEIIRYGTKVVRAPAQPVPIK